MGSEAYDCLVDISLVRLGVGRLDSQLADVVLDVLPTVTSRQIIDHQTESSRARTTVSVGKLALAAFSERWLTSSETTPTSFLVVPNFTPWKLKNDSLSTKLFPIQIVDSVIGIALVLKIHETKSVLHLFQTSKHGSCLHRSFAK